MYTILLVEDETAVRETIRDLTPWELYGFTVIGEAGNGIEALEWMDECLPDVVITDIKMPYMDGITFIETIHQQYPTVTIIILSGFDEFSYAQSAIRFNVSEYVLKPVSEEDIKQLLIRLKKRLDAEIVRRNDVAALRETFNKVLPLLKEKFLLSLLIPSQIMDNAWLIERSRLYGIPLEGDTFVVAAFETDQQETHLISADENHEESLIGIAMAQIVEESLEKAYNHPISVVFDNQIAIIFPGMTQDNPSNEKQFIKQVLRQLEQTKTYMGKYLGITPIIGLGSPIHEVNKISLSYTQAISALNYSRFQPNQKILFINDLEPIRQKYPNDSVILNQQLRADFSMAILMGTNKEIEAVMKKLFEEFASISPTYEHVQVYILEIFGILLEIATSYGIPIKQLQQNEQEQNLFVELQSLVSVGKANRWLTAFACRLREALSGVRKNSHIQFVEEAKRQIYLHYSEQNFSQEILCDHLGVSASYFSSTFKREIGTSFVQYLTMIRMERAKKLLKNTDLKTYEIADATGFSDPNYFSFCFKRYEGCSPSQYRQKMRIA